MSKHSDKWKFLAVSSTLIGGVACGAPEESAPNDHEHPHELAPAPEMNVDDSAAVPLAELDLSNGNRVGWYDLGGGTVLLGEVGNVGVAPITRSLGTEFDALSPAEQYRRLAPDQSVPRALVEFDAGLRAAQSQRNASDPIAAATEVEQVDNINLIRGDSVVSGTAEDGTRQIQQRHATVGCDEHVFFASEFSGCALGWPKQVLRPHRTGKNRFDINNLSFVRGGACSDSGTIRYRISTNTWGWWSDDHFDVNLQTGQFITWTVSNSLFDFDTRSKVDSADGDNYHVCAGGQDLSL